MNARLAIALTFATLALAQDVAADDQPRRSPLASYGAVPAAMAPEDIRQEYVELDSGPPPLLAAPLNARTAFSVAGRVEAIREDQRFDLAEESSHPIGEDRWVVNYSLRVRGKGVPVAGPTGKMLLLRRDGTTLLYRPRHIPEQLPTAFDATIAAKDAVNRARESALKPAPGSARVLPEGAELENTEPTLEIWVDAQNQGHLAWTFRVRARDVRIPFSRQYWFAATEDRSEPLATADLIFASHSGQVLGSVWQRTPYDGPTDDTPLGGVYVARINGGDRVITDSLGAYQFLAPSTAPDLLTTSLFGPNWIIFNDAGAELRKEFVGALPTVPLTMNFRSTAEFELAQTSAFFWANKCLEFTREKVGNRLTFVPIRVNLNDTGNAFWDGFALNFFRSGNGFPNTAYSDMIIHEYGHAVDGRLGGILNRPYGEGFGDALAILITEQPIVGRDFFAKGKHLRDASQVVDYKALQGQDDHDIGQAYGGFVWQLIKELEKDKVPGHMLLAKRLVLDAAAMNPKDIPDAVKLSFIADDDDRDLTNGTPHFKQLAAAADSRNITRPKRSDEK